MGKTTNKKLYEVEKQRLLKKLGETEPGTDEYKKIVLQLSDLEEANSKKKDNKDAIIKGSFAVGSVLAVLLFEKHGILTTKALGFIPKIH